VTGHEQRETNDCIHQDAPPRCSWYGSTLWFGPEILRNVHAQWQTVPVEPVFEVQDSVFKLGGTLMEDELKWWVRLLWAVGLWNWDRERNTWRIMLKKKHQAQTVFADPSSVPADYEPSDHGPNDSLEQKEPRK